MKENGYATLSVDGKVVNETATITCAHCNAVVHVPRKKLQERTDFCRQCMAMICARCAGQGCTPFLKKIEQAEDRDRIRRSYGS